MKNILICHRGGLGDFVFTWPALHCLKKAYPQYHVTGIGHLSYMTLAVSLGLLDGCHSIESSAMRDFFSGKAIPRHLGQPAGAVLWLTEAQGIEALLKTTATLPVVIIEPFPALKTHIAHYYCVAVQRHFPVDIPEKVLFEFSTGEKKGEYALIHPGSGSVTKNYSPDVYLSIAGLLKKSGYDKTGFILGPAEQERGMEKYFVAEKTYKPGSVSELASLLQSARLFIGNDSGVSHLSGMLGTPTMTLFKTTDPKIWGTIGKQVFNINTENAGDVLKCIKNLLRNFR